MDKAAFKDLLERYLANNCSEKERLLVEKLYDLLGEDKKPVIDDLDNIEDAIWNRIKDKTDFNQENKGESTTKFSPRRIGYTKTYLRVAAGILLFITAGLIWFQFQSDGGTEIADKKTRASQSIIANTQQKPMHIWLEDSTKVTLSPKSQLDIPITFSEQNKREVFLTGEAIFDVTKDASKPFLVYTGEVITRVIGTSFKITSHPDNHTDVEVAVLSGKVSVYSKEVEKKQKKVNNGVVLTPNQKVIYHTENKQFITAVVDDPKLLKPKKKDIVQKPRPTFIYDETPIELILDELEYNYGINIEVIENERFKKCPLTANLSQESLYDKLEMICASLNATYETKGTTILIDGQGCN